jgi:hypothetical protein
MVRAHYRPDQFLRHKSALWHWLGGLLLLPLGGNFECNIFGIVFG